MHVPSALRGGGGSPDKRETMPVCSPGKPNHREFELSTLSTGVKVSDWLDRNLAPIRGSGVCEFSDVHVENTQKARDGPLPVSRRGPTLDVRIDV